MPEPRLARAADSSLVLIDIQERLAAVMPAREAVVRAAGILAEAAAQLGIPVLATEQYPRGLGPTVPELTAKLPADAKRMEKTSFSACGALPLARPQAILAGMEAHVCVLQTALELAAEGREVFVVADAICSRTEANRANALTRLEKAGVVVTNTESVLFEWLRDASHEHFRAISKLIR
jgi:nicotinamidase-related amidase